MHCAFTYVTTHQSFRLIVKALNKFADSLIRPSAQQCPGFWFSLLNSWSMARTPLSIVFKSGLVAGSLNDWIWSWSDHLSASYDVLQSLKRISQKVRLCA